VPSAQTGNEMPELPQLVASIGGAIIGLAFLSGVVIRVVGGLLHRRAWKFGTRLCAAAVAGLGVVAGLYLLAVPLSFSLGWEAPVLIGAGLLWIAVGLFALRWIRRYDLPDAAWQRTEHDTPGP
jgi:hypothetical protein